MTNSFAFAPHRASIPMALVLLFAFCPSALPETPQPVQQAAVTLSWDKSTSPSRPLLMGQNWVNIPTWTNAYDDSRNAFYPEVTAALKEESPTVMRFPGGLFGNAFHWQQTIGPTARRTPYNFRHIGGADCPASTGADEFMELIRPVPDCEGLNIVNISGSRTCGGGTAEEAAAWVAYCNGKPADTGRIGVDSAGKDWKTVGYWAAKRAENGHSAPYRVKFWELGNEVNQGPDGKPTGPASVDYLLAAEEYVRRAKRYIAAMRKVDPSIKIGMVGWTDYLEAIGGGKDLASPKGGAPWLATVIPALRKQTDFFIYHYYNHIAPDTSTFANPHVYCQAVLGYANAFCAPRLAKLATLLREKAGGMPIWVTEYNRVLDWRMGEEAVLQQYNLLSGLAAADMMMVNIQEPSVESAEFFEFCGGMGTVWAGNGKTVLGLQSERGRVIRHPSHWVFGLFSRSFREPKGVILKPEVRCGSYTVLGFTVPALNAVAIGSQEDRQIDLLLLNRNIEAAVDCRISLAEIAGKVRAVTAVELNSWEPASAEPLFDNNFRKQKVFVKKIESPEIANGVIRAKLSPHSLTRYRIAL
jgi:alpha-L-arabinofuranosidase